MLWRPGYLDASQIILYGGVGWPGHQEKVLQNGKFIVDDVLPSLRKDSLGIEELYEGRE